MHAARDELNNQVPLLEIAVNLSCKLQQCVFLTCHLLSFYQNYSDFLLLRIGYRSHYKSAVLVDIDIFQICPDIHSDSV